MNLVHHVIFDFIEGEGKRILCRDETGSAEPGIQLGIDIERERNGLLK